jgi:hypothetical protein
MALRFRRNALRIAHIPPGRGGEAEGEARKDYLQLGTKAAYERGSGRAEDRARRT